MYKKKLPEFKIDIHAQVNIILKCVNLNYLCLLLR